MSSDKVKQQSSVKFPDSRDATELRQKVSRMHSTVMLSFYF